VKVATGSASLPAKAGVLWGTTWPADLTYSEPVKGQGQIVAAMVGAGFLVQWANIDTLAPTDQVYTDTPSAANATSNWWQVSALTFAASAGTTPAPFLLGTWGSTTNSIYVYQAGLKGLMAKLTDGVAMTVPQQQAYLNAQMAAFALLPSHLWLIAPGYHYAASPAYIAAYALLIKQLSSNPAGLTLVQQEAFLDAAIAAYVPPVVIVGAGNTAKLSWINPTQNTDGSPLTDSAGSDIYQGPSAGALVKVATVGPGISQWESPPLADGTYYFAVTDFNAATPSEESIKTPIVSTTIKTTAPTAKTPGQPTQLTITVTVNATAP